MTYFIHKTASGIAPQSGYERVSISRHEGAIWVLWRTGRTVSEITSEITGELKIIGVAPDADIVAVYPDIVSQKRAKIRAEGAKKLAQVAGNFIAEERETWTEQKEQAKKVLEGAPVEEYPMLAAFATGRGIPVLMLAQAIMTNNAMFQAASGEVLGGMYALLDQIAASADLASAMVIEWPS